MFGDRLSRNARMRASLRSTPVVGDARLLSRRTMASPFKLRRFFPAAALSRSYTVSGMFFRVRVVGMFKNLHFATIMVSPGCGVKHVIA